MSYVTYTATGFCDSSELRYIICVAHQARILHLLHMPVLYLILAPPKGRKESHPLSLSAYATNTSWLCPGGPTPYDVRGETKVCGLKPRTKRHAATSATTAETMAAPATVDPGENGAPRPVNPYQGILKRNMVVNHYICQIPPSFLPLECLASAFDDCLRRSQPLP